MKVELIYGLLEALKGSSFRWWQYSSGTCGGWTIFGGSGGS